MKPPIPIYLAVEDDLSEWVIRRLLQERSAAYEIGAVFKKGGFGYLKKKTPALNNLAKGCPVLLLTDLDQNPCPPAVLAEWLPQPRNADFLLRIAVREVEAWLLATGELFSGFLGLRQGVTFDRPEELLDPKHDLLCLSEKSPRRNLREALVRRDEGGNRRQGPAYNSTLGEFVLRGWSPAVAARRCPSLRRFISALESLELRWDSR